MKHKCLKNLFNQNFLISDLLGVSLRFIFFYSDIDRNSSLSLTETSAVSKICFSLILFHFQ